MQFIDKKIEDYAIKMSSLPSSLCKEIEVYTNLNVPMPQMLAGPLENSFLGFLIRLMDPKIIVELGTFTGYSTLSMAENLSEQGKIFTFDIDEKTQNIAKQFWSHSSHKNKIYPILKPAIVGLKDFKNEIDLAFVDANKTEYPDYLDILFQKLSAKGIIIVDNVLWSGKVLEANPDKETMAIREATIRAKNNPNFYTTLLPIRDGLLLIQRRQQ